VIFNNPWSRIIEWTNILLKLAECSVPVFQSRKLV
jgi:hypothetical protein